MPTLRELLEEGKSFTSGIDYNKVEAQKQTLSDFEANGLRPGRLNLGTNLYGADTLRITKQSTALVDDMRASTNANQGLLGEFGKNNPINLIREGTKEVNNFASKLGLPVLQIPTRVKDSIIDENDNVSNLPTTLAKIKKDGAGNIIGKFLKQTAKGTPNQVGRRAISSGLSLAKSAAKDALFGTGEVDLSPSANDTINNRPFGADERYHDKKLYGKTIKPSKNQEKGLKLILNGMVKEESEYNSFLYNRSEYETNNYADPKSKQVQPNFPEFPEFSVKSLTQNIPGKIDKTYTNVSNDNAKLPYVLETKNGSDGKFRTKSDTINLSDLYTDENDSSLDDYDFIPLRFYSIGKQQGVAFKATVNGISENFSPAWEGSNFLGNPYTFYNYQTMDRDLTFSFSVYALNAEEHKKNWEKLDFLTSLVYPQNTTNDVYVTPPLLKVTMGNMYKNKLGFIESLSYTIDDSTPWEIGIGAEKQGNRISSLNNSMKDYKLPTIINVAVSYQIIETSSDVVGKKLYPYGTSMIYGEQ